MFGSAYIDCRNFLQWLGLGTFTAVDPCFSLTNQSWYLFFFFFSHWITDSIFPESFHWALQAWAGYFSPVFLHSSTSHTWLWLPATSSPLLTSGWSGWKHITWDGICLKILVNIYWVNEDACLLKSVCPLVRGLLYTTNPFLLPGPPPCPLDSWNLGVLLS